MYSLNKKNKQKAKIMADRTKQVEIAYSPTFDESRHGENGYAKDPLTPDELKSFAAPALAGFKGESLQQARITVDGEKSPLAIEVPFDTTEFAEARALDALTDQQNRDKQGGFLGASNAHLQAIRRR